jgi:hypothetical protein
MITVTIIKYSNFKDIKRGDWLKFSPEWKENKFKGYIDNNHNKVLNVKGDTIELQVYDNITFSKCFHTEKSMRRDFINIGKNPLIEE